MIDPGTTDLQTKRGTKLITSLVRFWGAARKVNYTGDWLMGSVAGVYSVRFSDPLHATRLRAFDTSRPARRPRARAKHGADWLHKEAVPCMLRAWGGLGA